MNRRQLFHALASVPLALVGLKAARKAEPVVISEATAARLRAAWDAHFSGAYHSRVVILDDGVTYTDVAAGHYDAHITEAFHVPSYKKIESLGSRL